MIGIHRSVLSSSTIICGCRRTLNKSGMRFNASIVEASGKTLSKPASVPSVAADASFAERQPFIFQLIVATAKTSAADLVCQVVAEGKDISEIDLKRNALFVVFGATYLGGFQYWLMVNKYRHWFPTMDKFGRLSLAEKMKDTAGILDAAKMVVFDVVIHLPMLYFPSFYTAKEFIFGNSWNPVDWVRDGVSKYVKNSKEDLVAMIQLWGPSDCIQFALPTHIRMPFRHMVSFFWTAYVSFTRGSSESKE